MLAAMVAVVVLPLMVLCILVVLVVQVQGEHQDHQVVVDLQHNQVHMVQELIMEIEEETMLMDLVAVGHQLEEEVQVHKEQIHLPKFQAVGMEELVYN